MALVKFAVISLADVSDCTFVTSINFLLKRLKSFGIEANVFPLAVDLWSNTIPLFLHPHGNSSPFSTHLMTLVADL